MIFRHVAVGVDRGLAAREIELFIGGRNGFGNRTRVLLFRKAREVRRRAFVPAERVARILSAPAEQPRPPRDRAVHERLLLVVPNRVRRDVQRSGGGVDERVGRLDQQLAPQSRGDVPRRQKIISANRRRFDFCRFPRLVATRDKPAVPAAARLVRRPRADYSFRWRTRAIRRDSPTCSRRPRESSAPAEATPAIVAVLLRRTNVFVAMENSLPAHCSGRS